MPSFTVATPGASYPCVVRRGAIESLWRHLPERTSQIFIVTTRDVWDLHGRRVEDSLGARAFKPLFFPGGEDRKRMAEVEALAEQMVERQADRASVVVAFGGGIVGDLAGFLAAIFMRGIPFIQVPTTLLAQVDASVGGKTGANLVRGKNLVGAFHQPVAVVIDPDVLSTLPEREYRAGLYEVIKTGIIRSPKLFDTLSTDHHGVLAGDPQVVEDIIAESVRIKADVVSADEREGDLRRILNFGHTIGHALEAETQYSRLLHGEAVSFGMRAVTHLARALEVLDAGDHRRILDCLDAYGPIPSLDGVSVDGLLGRLGSDKKAIHGKVHFVLPVRIGETRILSGVDPDLVRRATETALAEVAAQ